MKKMALGLFAFIVLASICSPEAITFKWTTPTGNPTQYDMRSHVDSATLRSNWAGSSVVPGLPVPLVAGAKDSVSFAVNSSVPLYFGIKSVDLADNWSTGFNIVSVAPTTPIVNVPVGTHKWLKPNGDTLLHDGGPPYNYLDIAGNTWKSSDLTWIADGGDIVNYTNNHYSRIDGITNIVEFEMYGRVVKQRAFGLFAYRRSTHQRVMLDNTPDFSNRTFSDSIVLYTDVFPNVDLRVKCRLDALSLHWTFKQAARDAFETWWQNNGFLPDIYLVVATRFDISAANDIVLYDSTGEIDITNDIDVKRNMRFFRSDGKRLFLLHYEYLDQFLPAETDAGMSVMIPVYKRVVQIAGKGYLLEGVKWTDAQQIPAGVISHNVQFGNSTTAGGTNATIGNRQRGNTATPASSGTMDSLVVYFNTGSGVASYQALYNSAGTVLLDTTISVAGHGSGWIQSAVTQGASITGSTEYGLWTWADGGSLLAQTSGATGEKTWVNVSKTYGGGWDNEVPITLGNEDVNEQFVQYGVYTISGGPAPTSTRRRKVLLGGR